MQDLDPSWQNVPSESGSELNYLFGSIAFKSILFHCPKNCKNEHIQIIYLVKQFEVSFYQEF